MKIFNLTFVYFIAVASASVLTNVVTRMVLSNYLRFEIAVIASHLVGMFVAYYGMKVFVFDRSGRTTQSELMRFAAVNVISATQTWLISVVLLRVVFKLAHVQTGAELFAHLIGLASTSISSFLMHKHFSFQGKKA